MPVPNVNVLSKYDPYGRARQPYSCRAVLKPGWHFLIPWVDEPRIIHWRRVALERSPVSDTRIESVLTDKVDLREHLIDLGNQCVITRDTVQLELDALVYFRIVDP